MVEAVVEAVEKGGAAGHDDIREEVGADVDVDGGEGRVGHAGNGLGAGGRGCGIILWIKRLKGYEGQKRVDRIFTYCKGCFLVE